MDKESFVGAFSEWYGRNKDVVNERVHVRRIKWNTPPYMRPRLRSAYLSIKRNMPLLWTFHDHHNPKCPLMNFEEQITTQNVHITKTYNAIEKNDNFSDDNKEKKKGEIEVPFSEAEMLDVASLSRYNFSHYNPKHFSFHCIPDSQSNSRKHCQRSCLS